jgi:glycosyltransferase involved in cell wall biosynthesis
MKLSVVIPTRTRDVALARCLESLRSQVISELDEVIVSDDGVSKTTQGMIESRFSFARWTAGPQRGPAANRNHGASLTNGDFIVFLDDDVEPSPDLLSAYRSAIVSDIDVYEGRTTCRQGLRSPLEDSPINETGGYLWSCNMMIRTTCWQKSGGFDEDFPYPHMEDVAFRDRLAATAVRSSFVASAVVDHPPRPVPGPRLLARQHESYFVYTYKYLGRRPSLYEFAGAFLRHRLGTIRAYRLSSASVVALGSMCVEAAHILKYWHGWDKKWRNVQRI